MRWRSKKGLPVGAVVVVRRFLFWPKTINGETRWLEMGYWVEERENIQCVGLDHKWAVWNTVKWTTKGGYKNGRIEGRRQEGDL